MPRSSDPPGVDAPLHAPMRAAAPGTALYVHVPFCEAKCPYCDFLSLVAEGEDLPGTVDALLAEAARRAPERPRTVFLGGGTPSLLSADDTRRLIDGLDQHSGFRDSAVEVTCECNPESLDERKAAQLLELGVNRLSIGFQSLRQDVLTLFGRVHDVDQSFRAFEAARAAGFRRVSVDLIYGAPGQGLEDWLEDLGRVIALEPEHISAYCLTYEEGTLFHRWREEGRLQQTPDELELELGAAAERLLDEAGYTAYEVSNFARNGHECAHNVNYWRNGDYVGIGPSAVSYVGGTRFGSPRNLAAWRRAVDGNAFPASWEETLEAPAALAETWWLGLRLAAGVEPGAARATARYPAPSPGSVDPAEALARELATEGLLETDGGRWLLTPRGRTLADGVAAAFLREVPGRSRDVQRAHLVASARGSGSASE